MILITQKNIERLEKIVSHYAMQDYKQANEAREILAIARAGKEEERVKGYLLRKSILFGM